MQLRIIAQEISGDDTGVAEEAAAFGAHQGGAGEEFFKLLVVLDREDL